jgi:transcriptional regulator with XRE-family HTH domain
MAVKPRKRPLTQDPAEVWRRRGEAGLGQSEAAARIGISRQHLSNIERGVKAAGPAVLNRIAATYGCRVAELMPAKRAA